jgi:predicted Zn-ribbon and HTH transcriptional regulator
MGDMTMQNKNQFVDLDKMPKHIRAFDVIEILQRAQIYAKDSGLDIVQNELHNIEVSVGRLPRTDVVEPVYCKDCKYLTFSDCYGECGKAILGIVKPDDYCSRGGKTNKTTNSTSI